jgi:transcriptional repressor NrdR
VRKRNGRLEAFSATKLTAGVSAALADRPVSSSEVRQLVSEVEDTLRSSGAQVTSEEIGREVLEQLKRLDEVAYLRFASVYKEFQDAGDFHKEMAELESAE